MPAISGQAGGRPAAGEGMTIEAEFARFRGMSVPVKIQGDAPPDFDEGKPEGEPHRWISTGLWRIESAVRAAMLAAHVEACEHPQIRPMCGLEGAYCDKAKAIQALGKESIDPETDELMRTDVTCEKRENIQQLGR